MYKNIVIDFEKRLKSIASHATDEFSSNWEMHDGIHYSLPQEQALLRSELIKDFIEKTKSEAKFSEQSVSIEIKKLFAAICSEPNKSYISEIEALAIELESYNISTTVHMKVLGLVVAEKIKLGKVSFEMCNETYINNILTPALLDSQGVKSQKALEFENLFKPEITKDLVGSCVAKVTLVAEPTRAYERAKDEIRRVIDILRYACTNSNFSEDIRIGIVGDYPRSDRFGYILQDKRFVSKPEAVGSPRSYTINEESLKTMDELGALKLFSFLENDSLSSFQECLIRAVHWFSSGVTQPERETGYLHLMIALEALFTPEKGDPISNTIAESVALVINDTLSGRKALKKFLKYCYSNRSSIAHGGKKAVSDFDLKKLTIIVTNVILCLTHIEEKFNTRDELFAHLEDLKFSPSTS
jgi:hypothetical protein